MRATTLAAKLITERGVRCARGGVWSRAAQLWEQIRTRSSRRAGPNRERIYVVPVVWSMWVGARSEYACGLQQHAESVLRECEAGAGDRLVIAEHTELCTSAARGDADYQRQPVCGVITSGGRWQGVGGDGYERRTDEGHADDGSDLGTGSYQGERAYAKRGICGRRVLEWRR